MEKNQSNLREVIWFRIEIRGGKALVSSRGESLVVETTVEIKDETDVETVDEISNETIAEIVNDEKVTEKEEKADGSDN
jgi:hypothetical protein